MWEDHLPQGLDSNNEGGIGIVQKDKEHWNMGLGWSFSIEKERIGNARSNREKFK